jgi:hypothetical protein
MQSAKDRPKALNGNFSKLLDLKLNAEWLMMQEAKGCIFKAIRSRDELYLPNR